MLLHTGPDSTLPSRRLTQLCPCSTPATTQHKAITQRCRSLHIPDRTELHNTSLLRDNAGQLSTFAALGSAGPHTYLAQHSHSIPSPDHSLRHNALAQHCYASRNPHHAALDLTMPSRRPASHFGTLANLKPHWAMRHNTLAYPSFASQHPCHYQTPSSHAPQRLRSSWQPPA